MTHSELFKLYELKGRLKGRARCLESDIISVNRLIGKLETVAYRERMLGRLDVLTEWEGYNARLQEEVERAIKEAENARD